MCRYCLFWVQYVYMLRGVHIYIVLEIFYLYSM